MSNRDVSEQSYQHFSQFLEQETGIMLGPTKQYLVRSRLVGLLHDYAGMTVDGLIESAIRGVDRELKRRVLEAMTTNETLWFRDTYPFTLLSDSILPTLADRNRKLRIWSAACSSGQEAYSIAMTLMEYKNRHPSAFKHGFEVIGTDISEKVVEMAKSGYYNQMSVHRGLPDSHKTKYFTPAEDGGVKVSRELSRHTLFKQMNLLSSYAGLGKFDVVFCRNVLIYFSAENKKKILQQIAACLENDGSLLLGASESVSAVADTFSMIKAPAGLYYQRRT